MVERSLNPHPGREVEQIMSSCGLRAFPNVQDTPKGSGLSRSPLIVAVPIIHMATMKRQRPLTEGLKWGSVWSWDETGHSEHPGPGRSTSVLMIMIIESIRSPQSLCLPKTRLLFSRDKSPWTLAGPRNTYPGLTEGLTLPRQLIGGLACRSPPNAASWLMGGLYLPILDVVQLGRVRPLNPAGAPAGQLIFLARKALSNDWHL